MLIFGIGGNIDDIGGVENSIKALITACGADEPITLVCHAHKDGKTTQYQPPSGTDLTIIEYTARSWKKSPLNEIYRKLYANNPDSCVICRHHRHVVAAASAGFKTVYLVPSMIHSQVRAELAGPLNIEKLRLVAFGILNHWSQKSALKLTSRVAAFSVTMKRQIERVVSEPSLKAPILLCKPGIDNTRFYPGTAAERQSLRTKFQVPDGSLCLVIVSRLVAGKGIELAIQAMQSLGKGYHLMIIGDGLRRLQYEELAKCCEPDTSVHFWGAQSNVEEFYRCADIFLMTSKAESLGQTILEAGASGLPIIAFSKQAGVTTATEELSLGDYVTFAHHYSVDALTEAILLSRTKHATPAQVHDYFRGQFHWRTLLEELMQAC